MVHNAFIEKYLSVMVALFFAGSLGLLSSCDSDSPTGPGPASGSVTFMSQRDTDGDGIRDLDDSDDDNDGIPDDSDTDDDNDGILDDDESDSDGDGTIDDHDDDFAELKGTISSIAASSFVAFGYTVIVDQNTQLKGDNDQPITFGELGVGMIVEVHGTLVDDKTLLAREVEVEDDLMDDVPLGSLAPGDYVQIKGVTGAGSSYVITEIHRQPAESEFEYDGPVESAASDALAMLGVTFQVNAGTRFEDETGGGKTYDDLVPGNYVDVRAVYDSGSQTFTATRVRLVATPQPFIKVEARVFSVNPGAGTAVVGGVSFVSN